MELTRFLDDARTPAYNDAAERARREVVLGRKNYYRSHLLRGTRLAAPYSSLQESALPSRAAPKAYRLKASPARHRKAGTVTLPLTPQS